MFVYAKITRQVELKCFRVKSVTEDNLLASFFFILFRLVVIIMYV